MGATEIVSTTDLWKRWLAGPENRIDSRAFLRARVLDLWLDNFDRHRGQWRWMRIPGQELYQPLPEDPDMVLVHHDGLLMANLRGRIPKQLKFGRDVHEEARGAALEQLRGGPVAPLRPRRGPPGRRSRRTSRVASPTEVIDGALRRMPPQWYAINGKETLAALEKRRAGLVDYVLRVYDYYAKDVDVHATDRAEVVTLARGADDSLEVTIALADGGASPWYRRRFLPGETDEVRVYLHGGDDRVTRTGPAGGPIRVRVVAGGGKDVVDDSQERGHGGLEGRGHRRGRPGPGHERAREGLGQPPPREGRPVARAPQLRALDRGERRPRVPPGRRARARLRVHADRLGLPDRARLERPVAAGRDRDRATGRARSSTAGRSAGRRPALSLRFETFLSDIEQFNYFGYGNESLRPPSYGPGYRAAQTVVFASPTLRYDLGRRFETYLGPEVRYSDAPLDDETTIGIGEAYGTGKFGQVALRGGLHFDSRERPDSSAALQHRGGPLGRDGVTTP